MRWAAKDPFGLTADPRMYVARPATEEALDELRALLDEGESTVRLAGPAGLGKTLLLRLLPERLGPEWLAAYLGYPKLSPDELWVWVAEELGFGHPSEEGIRAVAARAARRGGGLVLLVDDAQSMPEETRRVLAGICSREPGLRVLLTETCEIDELGHPAEVRLAEPLSVEELKEYLEERVDRAGVGGLEAALFEDVDPGRLYALSQGVPARVHYLAARLQCGDRLPEPGAPADPASSALADEPAVSGARSPGLAPVAPEIDAEPAVFRILPPPSPPRIESVPEPVPESPPAVVLAPAPAADPTPAEDPGPPVARLEPRPDRLEAAPGERAEIAAIAASLDADRLRAAAASMPNLGSAETGTEPDRSAAGPLGGHGAAAFLREVATPWRASPGSWGWAPIAAAVAGLILLTAGLGGLMGTEAGPGSQERADPPAIERDPSHAAASPPSTLSPVTAGPPSGLPPMAAGSPVAAAAAAGPSAEVAVPHESSPVPAEIYRTAAQPGPAVAPASLVGYLSVNAVPWAQIEIDGEPFGETPLGEVALPVGEHDVRVRFPDGREVARRVHIGDEEIFLVVRQDDS